MVALEHFYEGCRDARCVGFGFGHWKWFRHKTWFNGSERPIRCIDCSLAKCDKVSAFLQGQFNIFGHFDAAASDQRDSRRDDLSEAVKVRLFTVWVFPGCCSSILCRNVNVIDILLNQPFNHLRCLFDIETVLGKGILRQDPDADDEICRDCFLDS